MDSAFLQETLNRIGTGKESLIPILQAIQGHFRFLPKDALRYVCEHSEITPADLYGVATFYSQFRHEPTGEHVIHVCTGTACHVKGAELVLDAFRQHLHIDPDHDTDFERQFTIQKVACLGCCTLAPVVQIQSQKYGLATYGHLTPSMIPDVIDDFLSRSPNESAARQSSKIAESSLGEIRIGLGSCCQAQGSANVHREIVRVLDEIGSNVRIKPVGCVGMCHQTPLLETVSSKGISTYYAKVKPEDVRSILFRQHPPTNWLKRTENRLANWVRRFWSDEFPDSSVQLKIEREIGPVSSFLDEQRHLAMEHCGEINPIDLDEYIQTGGFEAAKKAHSQLSPDEIIDEIEKAGIRGRGGAGFPTDLKWLAVRGLGTEDRLQSKRLTEEKYVICNGDEGDPGAFMDRMLLESFPFRIIEGMLIAAKAVGANKGYLYIRAEYPLAVQRVNAALEECYKRGILGESIFGTDFSFELRVKEGAGAFVCGEETALLESIEGKRGMPRLRPPYPAKSGLYGKPTLINNVETFALVTYALKYGGESLKKYGVPKNSGTKVFALAGKIQRGGLIEVPLGITIRKIVEEIGGGVANGKKFKAVQIGGPSGGCVPADLADTPIDFESLAKVGAIMGSGGLVVLDEDDCMIDIARYFLEFTQEQSCGKCTFCRIGTRRMLEILNRLTSGDGKDGDIEKLENLAQSVKLGSLCGLGKTAPNPVLSTIQYFRNEYEAHIRGECPAGKCKALIQYDITEKCNGCTHCVKACSVEAIEPMPYRRHKIEQRKCTKCGVCLGACPENAIQIAVAKHP